MSSFPYFWYPVEWTSLALTIMLNGLKGVESSENLPFIAANFAMRHSMQCPMVILEGMQWGLTIISGTIPSIVKGRSSWRYVIPHVPFWPCLEANLSPIWGILTLLTLTFANLLPVAFSETITRSTTPRSALLERREASLNFPLAYMVVLSLLSEGVRIFPTRIYSSSMVCPGGMMPSVSSLRTASWKISTSLLSGLQILLIELLAEVTFSSVL